MRTSATLVPGNRMAAVAHPLLATGPAAEGFGPALSVILEEEFTPHLAGSLVFVNGLRPDDNDTFKRRKTSAQIVRANSVTSELKYPQPAFFVDSTTPKQDAVALQTYGVLTVKVQTSDADTLPGPGTVLAFAADENIGGSVYTVLKEASSADDVPAAFVLNAEWVDGQPHTHCVCRVFVSQMASSDGSGDQGSGGGGGGGGILGGIPRSVYNAIFGR